MVITLHKFKILLSLVLLSHPTISNFYQSANCNFFGLVIHLIIITIISDITVLVQHNVVCFGYFMLMSHGVIKKAPQPPQIHHPLFLQAPLLNIQTVQATSF